MHTMVMWKLSLPFPRVCYARFCCFFDEFERLQCLVCRVRWMLPSLKRVCAFVVNVIVIDVCCVVSGMDELSAFVMVLSKPNMLGFGEFCYLSLVEETLRPLVNRAVVFSWTRSCRKKCWPVIEHSLWHGDIKRRGSSCLSILTESNWSFCWNNSRRTILLIINRKQQSKKVASLLL